RELDLDGERCAVPRVAVRVPETRVHLVQGVPGRPFPVQVEGGGADFAAGEGRERLPSSLQGAEVAVAVSALHGRELLDDVRRALFEPGVTRGRPHQAHGREVMTSDVPGEIAPAAVPPAVRLCFRREAGALPVIRQHAVGLEREQVLPIELLRVLERPARQADRAQGEGAGPADAPLRDAPWGRCLRGRHGYAAQQRYGTRSKTEPEGAAARERHAEPP